MFPEGNSVNPVRQEAPAPDECKHLNRPSARHKLSHLTLTKKTNTTMGKKTSKHIRAAAVNADRHNRREKHLDHPRPELQPEDKAKWIWEVEDKKSVYQMQKQAKLDHATEELNGKLAEMDDLQKDLQKAERFFAGKYRLNSEQRKAIKQLEETNRQLQASIEHLKPIAGRVPGLEERIRELETALKEKAVEVKASEDRGRQEGRSGFVRDMYAAAGMKQPQTEPTAETVGRRYGKYWEASMELGGTKEKLSQTERSLEEEKEWHAIDKEEKEKAMRVINAIWNGMWEAIKTLCDGENNRDWLTGAEKDIIRKPLSSAKTAKQRIGYGIDLVSFASACRPLSASVKGEVLQLAAEDGVTQLEKLGVDIAAGKPRKQRGGWASRHTGEQ